MNKWDCKSAKVGENLPDLIVGPISRTNLALYAGASGDHNPLHIDTDYTKQITVITRSHCSNQAETFEAVRPDSNVSRCPFNV